MKKKMFFALLGAMSLMAGCSAPPQTPPQAEPAPAAATHESLIINLTSDPMESAHGAMMGLHLAQKALADGMSVTVFLNVDGVKLLQAGADTLVFHGENISELLGSVSGEGGKILACPHCLHVHGLSEADLRPGVELAQDSVLLGKIRQAPTVFTY